MRVRRRRYCFVRIQDQPVLDVAAFFRGEARTRSDTVVELLCAIYGTRHALSGAELAALAALPDTEALPLADASARTGMPASTLAVLVQREVLIDEDALPGTPGADLAAAEARLAATGWHDLAALYQAQTRWTGVVGNDAAVEHAPAAERARLETHVAAYGAPPAHFVHRADAEARLPLALPEPDALAAVLAQRRTTRHFDTAAMLPRAALEAVLYGTFGAHGIRELASGITAIKKTSASGGGLHPVEAYVLAIRVDGVPCGLYHYQVADHALARLETLDELAARALATRFVAGQAWFSEAHALVVHVARFHRHFWKYVEHAKAYKAVLMDSAHLSQTLYLIAAARGLGAFYTAAVNDADIGERLRLALPDEAALAVSGIGIADPSRHAMHFLPEPYRPALAESGGAG